MSGMTGSFCSLLLMAAVALTGCNEQASETKEQADEGTPAVEGPASPGFDYQSDHVFASPPWEYRYTVGARGTRSEGYYGVLLYDGIEVPAPASVNDYYQTPWGPMYWVGDPGTLFGDHGWMAHLRESEPMGVPLPDPADGFARPDPGSDASGPARMSLACHAGQTWQLAQLSLDGMESTLLLDVQRLPTITIQDGSRAIGYGGVNTWYADYEEPAPGEIAWSGFTTTEMFGDSPEQDLETIFYQVLTSTTRTNITEDEMVFSNADSSMSLAFVRLQ